MVHLRNTKDSLRIYESYGIKDSLKQNGYTFDSRGFWYKLARNIASIKNEYHFLRDLDVDLLMPDGISLEDAELIGLTIQEISTMAAQNPAEGIELLQKWTSINEWSNGPKSIPARETIF